LKQPFIALLYNGVNSSIDAMRGKHDTMGSMAAGAVTGAIFKSTGSRSSISADIYLLIFYILLAGIKPAIAAATVISGIAGIWSYVKKSV
jgi:import inner membrane translocase subunit TIM23